MPLFQGLTARRGTGEFFTGSYIVLRRGISLGRNLQTRERVKEEGEEQYLARKRKFSSFAVVLSFFFSFLFLFSLESSEMIWRECEWLNCVIRC